MSRFNGLIQNLLVLAAIALALAAGVNIGRDMVTHPNDPTGVYRD
jgi:hypothetical protein